MARSPSPRRDSRDYRRYSRSPDRRRRSRSPRERRRSPRRNSPDYRPYRKEEREPYRNHHRPRSPRADRGGRRRRDDDISDDDIKADSLQDFRRLKRIKMMERGYKCIWRNTPTPPPEERARILAQQEAEQAEKERAAADAAREAARAKSGGRDKGGGGSSKKNRRDEREKGVKKLNDENEEKEEQEEEEEEDEGMASLHQQFIAKEVQLFRVWLQEHRKQAEVEAQVLLAKEEDEKIVGPEPIPGPSELGIRADYGTHLRPGEGNAMAAFVQEGARIPRRGEVGLDATEIEKFEQVGYVMSGSRHARMNAVRIRKENQVYTAEEKAALAMFNFEENKRKEAKILDDMRRLVDSTLGGGGGGEGGGGGGGG